VPARHPFKLVSGFGQLRPSGTVVPVGNPEIRHVPDGQLEFFGVSGPQCLRRLEGGRDEPGSVGDVPLLHGDDDDLWRQTRVRMVHRCDKVTSLVGKFALTEARP